MTALGVILVVVALALVLAEAHLSTGGWVAAGAIVLLLGGVALLLSGAGAGAVTVAVVVIGTAGATLPALWIGRRRIMRPLLARPRTGSEALVGHLGVIRSADSDAAAVFVDGALWRAEPDLTLADNELHPGDRVVVERVNGLTLGVRRAEAWELNP